MSEINVTILGTTAGVPTKRRAHPAIYLSYRDREEFSCLFDCGEGAQRQMMIAGLAAMKIDHIFLTHWHGDHCLGLPGLVDTMGFEDRKKPLTVYAPDAGRVRRSINTSLSMGRFPVKAVDVPSKGAKIKRLLDKERFFIESVPVKHGVPAAAYAFVEKEKMKIDPGKAAEAGLPEEGEIYAEIKKKGKVEIGDRSVRIEDISSTRSGRKLVYSGDTEICENLKNIARGADLLIQDCTYFNVDEGGKPHMHASLPEVVEMAAECGVKKTVLTHISRKYQDDRQLKDMLKGLAGFQVADDFIEVSV